MSRSSAAATPAYRPRCGWLKRARRSWRCEAVEIGFGGAGRNVGLVNAGMWILPSELLKALGAEYGERR